MATATREVIPPPSYNDTVEQASGTVVDDLANAVYHNLNLSSDRSLPTEDQALAHLRLLQLFHNLKTQISNTDGLFGFYNDDVTAQFSGPDDKPEIQARLSTTLADKRWAVYLTRAVDRFVNWWEALRKTCTCQPVTWADMEASPSNPFAPGSRSAFQAFLEGTIKPYQLQYSQLPPLDVLMVWHAYMLNPRNYLEDCLFEGAVSLWKMSFPWEMINSCIDTRTEEYTAPAETIKTFEQASNLKWNNLEGINESVKPCPNVHCRKLITIPYTSIDRLEIIGWAKDNANGNEKQEMPRGNGYADKGLLLKCPACQMDVDHEFLRAAKFVSDYAWVVNAGKDETLQRPMRGTILDNDGLVKPLMSFTDQRTFPNRLLYAMATTDRPLWTATSIEMIRSSIEASLRSARTLQKAIKLQPGQRRFAFSRLDRIYVRRMMSRYWDNSSPFGLDLVGAVIRQGSFIDKMVNIDWLHSPTARSTMSRLLVKYQRFFYIMASNPTKLIVPTLDVDLAWHTHQLSPSRYYDYSVHKTRNKFINHDDKVPELSLNNAFAETSKIYQDLYKEPYSECTCWYCEAIRATHHSSLSRMFSRSIPPEESSLYDPSNPAPCDPQTGPHISAHNAARPILPPRSTPGHTRYSRLVEQSEKSLLSAYNKACKRAQKQGRNPPEKPPILNRTNPHIYAYGVGAFAVGYGLYTLPYMAPTCDGNVHPCDPIGANVGPGTAGNCAAGTCGGGVAAGGCGGGGAAAGWGSGGDGGAGSNAVCAGAGDVGGGGGGGGCGGGGGGFGGCSGGGGGGGGCGGGGGGGGGGGCGGGGGGG